MPLDIIPGVGIGSIARGSSARDVVATVSEQEQYEDWMGGNNEDARLFHGLMFWFGREDDRLHTIVVYGREDATLFGQPLAFWTRDSIRQRLRDEGYAVESLSNGDLGVKGKLELSFDPDGELTRAEVYLQ